MLGNYCHVDVQGLVDGDIVFQKRAYSYEEWDSIRDEFYEKYYYEDSAIHKDYKYVQCDCGELVLCYNFTNTCDCGSDYNMSGTLLANRSQWGSETGENWTDCY